MDPLRDAKASIETLSDGVWNRRDLYAIADLLTKAALLLTLAAPAVCAVQGDEAPPASDESGSSDGSGTDSE